MGKKILAVSAGLVHPSLMARRSFREILRNFGGAAVSFSTSVESLTGLDEGVYGAVVMYLHRKKISDEALAALDGFVSGGGGFLAVHSASASFKSRDRYFEILGGRFVRHGAVQSFELRRESAAAGPFGDINSFTVRDELYIHDCESSNTVHFTAGSDGGREPQVWTRSYGRGRVCYFAPGHCAGTIENPGAAAVLTAGLKWILGIIE